MTALSQDRQNSPANNSTAKMAFASLSTDELLLLRSGLQMLSYNNAMQLRSIGTLPVSTFAANTLNEHLVKQRNNIKNLDNKITQYINALLDR